MLDTYNILDTVCPFAGRNSNCCADEEGMLRRAPLNLERPTKDHGNKGDSPESEIVGRAGMNWHLGRWKTAREQEYYHIRGRLGTFG